MNKFYSLNITAGILSKSFKKTVETLIASAKGFLFISTIKSIRGFWKKFQSKVIAMTRQLEYSTFLMKLPCAFLHWNDLIANIFKL